MSSQKKNCSLYIALLLSQYVVTCLKDLDKVSPVSMGTTSTDATNGESKITYVWGCTEFRLLYRNNAGVQLRTVLILDMINHLRDDRKGRGDGVSLIKTLQHETRERPPSFLHNPLSFLFPGKHCLHQLVSRSFGSLMRTKIWGLCCCYCGCLPQRTLKGKGSSLHMPDV